jgi:fumarate reductase subunit D
MSEEDIAAKVVKALEESRTISYETHHYHHEFIDSLIDKNNKRTELYDKLKEHVAKAGLLGVITFILWSGWHYISHLVHAGVK